MLAAGAATAAVRALAVIAIVPPGFRRLGVILTLSIAGAGGIIALAELAAPRFRWRRVAVPTAALVLPVIGAVVLAELAGGYWVFSPFTAIPALFAAGGLRGLAAYDDARPARPGGRLGAFVRCSGIAFFAASAGAAACSAVGMLAEQASILGSLGRDFAVDAFAVGLLLGFEQADYWGRTFAERTRQAVRED